MNNKQEGEEEEEKEEGFLFSYIVGPFVDFMNYLMTPKEIPITRFNVLDPKAKETKIPLVWTSIPFEEGRKHAGHFIYHRKEKTKDTLPVTYIPPLFYNYYKEMWWSTSTCKKHDDNCLLVEYGTTFQEQTGQHHITI